MDAAAVSAQIASLPVRKFEFTPSLLASAVCPPFLDVLAEGDAAQAVQPIGRRLVGPASISPRPAVINSPPAVSLLGP